ncbi:MAG: hypothetical protein JNJ54_05575 [Myxococcaceae bacterium]|nr:hypothetical protein [Myxococcaceae bacterium]
MLSWVTLLAVATAPSVGLTLSAQLGKTGTPPAVYLDVVEQELVAVGLPVRRLTTSCAGARECLIGVARTEKLAVLVGVTIAPRRKQTTLDIEALRPDDGASVAQLTFSVAERLREEDRRQVHAFAQRVKDALPSAPLVDAPVREPERAPPVVVVSVPLTETPPPPPVRVTRSRAPAWILLSGAGATAVTSGIFLGFATDGRVRVEATPNPSLVPRPEVEALAVRANRDYTIALVAGAAAAALVAGALAWLFTS